MTEQSTTHSEQGKQFVGKYSKETAQTSERRIKGEAENRDIMWKILMEDGKDKEEWKKSVKRSMQCCTSRILKV